MSNGGSLQNNNQIGDLVATPPQECLGAVVFLRNQENRSAFFLLFFSEAIT